MKKTLLIGLIMLAFTPEKKYSVSLTVSQWKTDIGILDYTQQVLKSSDAPARIVLPLIDSLSKIQKEFIFQLQQQMDTTKH